MYKSVLDWRILILGKAVFQAPKNMGQSKMLYRASSLHWRQVVRQTL